MYNLKMLLRRETSACGTPDIMLGTRIQGSLQFTIQKPCCMTVHVQKLLRCSAPEGASGGRVLGIGDTLDHKGSNKTSKSINNLKLQHRPALWWLMS
jgi:hypothetical protein